MGDMLFIFSFYEFQMHSKSLLLQFIKLFFVVSCSIFLSFFCSLIIRVQCYSEVFLQLFCRQMILFIVSLGACDVFFFLGGGHDRR